MSRLCEQPQNSGRANTVLVFDTGAEKHAVISAVIVHLLPDDKQQERVCFSKLSTFDEKTVRHVIEEIVPAADQVLNILGIALKPMEIAVINLEAASVIDTVLHIRGYSMDVPLFIAILSAYLNISVPADIVSTGHIASPQGDIRSVGSLPEKLRAARASSAIKAFIHPVLDQDGSLGVLSPEEETRARDALLDAGRDLETVAMADVETLVKVVFPANILLLLSLEKGYYGKAFPASVSDTPCTRAAKYILQENDARFWNQLEQLAFEHNGQQVKSLVNELVALFIRMEKYPRKLGSGLYALMESLPLPAKYKIPFPLFPMPLLIQLGQYAVESDHEDLRLLFKACHGEPVFRRPSVYADAGPKGGERSDREKFHQLIPDITNENLTRMIRLPIDSARSKFIMESVVADTQEQFYEKVTSFYIHMMRHMGSLRESVNRDVAQTEARDLLEKAFFRYGGIDGALAEASDATNGGLRLIFDVMTDYLKQKAMEDHVKHAITITIGSQSQEEKIAVIRGLLESMRLQLPEEIREQPPERFVKNYEDLVIGYVQSVDKMHQVFRRL